MTLNRQAIETGRPRAGGEARAPAGCPCPGRPQPDDQVERFHLVVLRAVLDVVQQCNLRCLYCHPGEVWRRQHLDVARIREVFVAAEQAGLLELVLSGGEIALHPQLAEILEATQLLQRTASTLITNATLVDDDTATTLGRSNLTRICVSIDGIDNETHGSARGKNLRRVLDGLWRIRRTSKPVTVITVVHQRNVARVLELSKWLAETGLADQHHLCAPSYSGEAREHYDVLKLRLEDFFTLQRAVDAIHEQLRQRGLFVTFNSSWPATGCRSPVVDGPRTITLQQLSEQVKDSLVHVRPNGDVRLAAASWGRETVGNAVTGDIHTTSAAELFVIADRIYREGAVGQLPRDVEAAHKFQIGAGANRRATDTLIDADDSPEHLVRLVPIRPLSALALLGNPFDPAALGELTAMARRDPSNIRYVRHATGVYLVFNRRRSHVTLIKPDEWPAFLKLARP